MRSMCALWAFGVLFAFSAQAQESIFWTNGAGGKFSNANNWSTNKIPTSADEAVFELATSGVIQCQGETVGRLTVSGSASFDLGTGFSAMDLMRIAGGFFTGSGGKMTVGSIDAGR